MSSSRSDHVLYRQRVSTIKHFQLQISRYKRENDNQKCLLMICLTFVIKSVYFVCSCSITNTIHYDHCLKASLNS